MARTISTSGYWLNDQFSLLDLQRRGEHWYAGTDDRVTNGNGVTVAVTVDADSFGVAAQHTIGTEPGGNRRIDELSVVSTYSHAARLLDDRVRVTAGIELGGAFSGPIGGLAIQNSFHHLIAPVISARTLGDGLQDRYEGGLNASLRLGVSGRGMWSPLSWLSVVGETSIRVNLGEAGAQRAAAAVGLRLGSRDLDHQFGAFIEARARGVAQAVTDPRLSIPGYANGFFVQPELAVGIGAGPLSLSFEVRGNEAGTGQGVGIIALRSNISL